MQGIEAFVIGRVGVDFTPSEARTSLARAETFRRAVGGFAGNVATGLSRLGIGTAVVGAVGDDGHGEYCRTFLAGEGVDVTSLIRRRGLRTQAAFFEAWPPEHFPVTFYRLPPAPEALLTPAELPAERIAAAPLVIVSGALLSREPARSTTIAILERRSAARRRVGWTVLDLDWRPTMWDEPADFASLVARSAPLSDALIGSDAEFAAAGLGPEDAVDLGAGVVVLKHGSGGASVLSVSGRQALPAISVEVVCGLGAGDALTAAFGAGVLRGLDPSSAAQRGNAAGAIVASRLMCSTAMPTPGEIDDLLARVRVGRAKARA